MRRAAATIFGVMALVVTTSGTAIAQESFVGLRSSLEKGDVVSITDDGGRQTRGVVESVGTSLHVSVDGSEREFLPQQVREIRRRGDPLSNGLMIGLLSGGAAGVVFGLGVGSILEAEGGSRSDALVGFLALGLGAGAGIGAGLDAAVTGSTVVYRRPTRTVSIAPMLGPRTQGLRIGIAF